MNMISLLEKATTMLDASDVHITCRTSAHGARQRHRSGRLPIIMVTPEISKQLMRRRS